MSSDGVRITRLNRSALRKAARAAHASGAERAEEGALLAGSEADVERVVKLVETLAGRGGRDEALVDLLLEDVEPRLMGAGHVHQLHLQASARAAFLAEMSLLTSREVGEGLGSSAQNTSAMASRLKREGKLFAIAHKGTDLYPAFQIAGGELNPAVARVLDAFGGQSAWTVALWFRAPSGWLGGARPMDLLDTAPDRVVEAARQTARPLVV